MRALVSCAVLAACVHTNTVTCPDGTTCGPDTTCVAIDVHGAPQTFCATDDQLSQCAGKAESDACTRSDGAPGSCHAGVCLVATCGNFLRDSGELCDDGNTVGGDECSADCSSDERCGNGFVDISLGEQCDPGDALGHDGCTSDCRSETPQWSPLAAVRPDPRDTPAMAYDARRHRVVLFGGLRGFLRNDTNEWDGDIWRRPALDVSPTPRVGAAMAYDAASQQIVLFSGSNGAPDTWIYDGRWRLRTSATAPPPRYYASMVYDEARKQIVLFGGQNPNSQGTIYMNDTWIWDGQDWHEVTTSPSPPLMQLPAVAYDPVRGVTVLFGGIVAGGTFLRSVWEFDGTTWADRTPAAGGPSARYAAVMANDPVGGGVILIGGNDPTVRRETWKWDGSTWTSLAGFGVVGEQSAAVATDPVRGRVVMYSTAGRIYEWDGAAWTAPPKAFGSPPSTSRMGASVALDPMHAQVVMIGGGADDQHETTDSGTWVWRGEWTQQPGTVPTPRRGAALAYDEAHRQLVAYGGCTWVTSGDVGLGDTWVWDGASTNWTQVLVGSNAGTRCRAGIAYDAARGQLVMFGGSIAPSMLTAAKTWIWDGSAWNEAAGAANPTPREPAAMAYDPISKRIVLFGGRSQAGIQSDTWTWDGQTWTLVDMVVHPSARNEATMAFDASRGRLVLTGGGLRPSGFVYSDTWEWDGSTWLQVATNGPTRRGAAMASAPDGAGMIQFGGTDVFAMASDPSAAFPDDTWQLRWDADTAYETCTDADTDRDDLIGCADPDCWWACTPLCPPSTTCATGQPSCGDGTYNASLELCYVCPQDAMACTARCGDFICDASESVASCPGDCTP